MNASLGAAAYAALKQAVLDASLAPGSTASEPEIAARLGMSRTPVHEAVLRLQAEGFLRVIPKRGVLVVPVARGDVADVYEVLIALEGAAAARLACIEARAALAELRALTAEMEQALSEGRRRAWAEADDAFHRLLLSACGNARLEAGAANALDLAGRARLLTLGGRPLAASAAEHWALIEALDAGDANTARMIIAEHRGRAAREMLALLP
jgi:DNA-binding GntR family transcriptional regulator